MYPFYAMHSHCQAWFSCARLLLEMKKNTVIRSLLCLISSLFFVLFSGASLGESDSKTKTNTEGERRIALVIGNAKYASSPLSNPTNDANDMAAKLKTLGFDVTLRLNTELKDFNRYTIWGDNKAGRRSFVLLCWARNAGEGA
jgi:hypothetical protein